MLHLVCIEEKKLMQRQVDFLIIVVKNAYSSKKKIYFNFINNVIEIHFI